MKIILHKPVQNLGEPGEVVQVADGYARNYLIPRGFAAPVTKGALRHAERLRGVAEERQRKALDEAKGVAERLAKSPVRLQAQAGEEGKLFGSITGQQVAEAIEQQLGQKIDHREIQLEQPIRSLGAHTVRTRLHPEVEATITLDVVAR